MDDMNRVREHVCSLSALAGTLAAGVAHSVRNPKNAPFFIGS